MSDGSDGLDRAEPEPQQPRDPKAEERAALIELYRRLHALTPRTLGTNAIVAANIAVWGVMVASGVHALSPTPETLIKWGANYGPKVSAGDWWRLFTAMFLHVGAVHIAMNMWGLWNVGRFIERALGTTTFVVVYLLSGWAGSIASVLVKPLVVSAGASGAIFGVFGVMLAFVLRPRRTVPRAALKALRSSTFFFLALNIWLGVKTPGIDLAAHGGGFVCGFVLGALLTHELSPDERRAATRRTLPLGAAVAFALVVATALLKGHVPDVQAVLMRFDAVERQVIAAFDDASQKATDGDISDYEFADIIDRDVLRPWRELRIDPATTRHLPREMKQLVHEVEEYRETREQGWQTIAHGLRARDEDEIEHGTEKLKKADELAEEMSKRAK